MTEEPTRTRIHRHIETHPGVHFNELIRTLDVANGQVQYHIHWLLGENKIAREEFYGRTHYYPLECAEWCRGFLALARRETTRDIVFDLLEHGPDRPSEVAIRVGIARSTLEWHLAHLVKQDVIEKRRGTHNRVTLVLQRPEMTLDLLHTIEPSLPERLVDRFERLLDHFLGEDTDTTE